MVEGLCRACLNVAVSMVVQRDNCIILGVVNLTMPMRHYGCFANNVGLCSVVYMDGGVTIGDKHPHERWSFLRAFV